MGRVVCPENILEEISADILLRKVIEKKKDGQRLVQICASYVGGKYELSYSFSKDSTYQLTTLRIVIDPETEVPSITEIIPHAFFHENEMKELFGVKVIGINVDYKDKLYRIKEETPFIPKEKEGE